MDTIIYSSYQGCPFLRGGLVEVGKVHIYEATERPLEKKCDQVKCAQGKDRHRSGICRRREDIRATFGGSGF